MSIITRITSGEFKHIIVLTGAGVSTGAGIPDYRSQSGIFAELMKEFPKQREASSGHFNLPQAQSPQDLFSRSFVIKHKVYDHPIYKERIQMIREAKPTLAHMLCKWFYDKGWLQRVYTQNIDGLHQKAGIPEDMVVEYHGSLLKNNVVLYGDSIPTSAIYDTITDFVHNKEPVDLILVMGTSLQVAPFCAIPNLVPKSCTRVLVDIHPENAFTNDWTKKKTSPEDMYGLSMSSSATVKFGKRLVSLRPQWVRHSKWKDQHIIVSDTDAWANSIMAHDI